MVSRCENPKNRDYKNYGARGIRVWRGWLTPGEGMANFISYVTSSLPAPSGMTLEAALTGRGASRLTLDRVDNDGGTGLAICASRSAATVGQPAAQRLRRDRRLEAPAHAGSPPVRC